MSTFALDLIGNAEKLRVSATDVAAHEACGRHLAVKIRPEVSSNVWRRSFGSEKTFILGQVAELVREAHTSDQANDPARLMGWLRDRIERRKMHRLLRPYAMAAVPHILEAHWDIEDEIGSLKLIRNEPSIGQPPRVLWAWAPLYSTEDGVREIRRYRLGSAHDEPDEKDLLWAQTAAQVAAKYAGLPNPTRIRVVEIGGGDGSISVVFDGTPAQAESGYAERARGIAGELGDLDDVKPGFECSSCKVAGACEGLIPVPGMIGQPETGYASRSLAPSDLDRYRQCPAQWLLASDLHLPRGTEYTGAQTRGLLVHQWLEAAHSRAVGCREADLPAPGGDIGLAADLMSAEEYAVAYPFLRHHVTACPLAADSVEVVEVETSMFGFDAAADVIAVTKPDLIYRIGDRLVVREFKTSSSLPSGGASQTYGQTHQVPFLISMLSAGVTETYAASDATVEVEVLTPEAGEVYAWDLEEPGLVTEARSDLALAAAGWHVDSTWETHTGDHCEWCPVRQWCPDGEAFQQPGGTAGATGPVFDPTDDPPPPY
ncbi:MAG: hypothetical protein JWR83_3533 [Aeromicrobium sp.]|nr:hypothetical protein [Aeromicrobium sp.]